MNDEQILDLHRRLVEIPSVSHEEARIADFVQGFLEEAGASVERIGDNVLARAGSGPRVVLNSHLDTVPATERWTRDPWRVEREGERIYGLGSNDAKASVAAMIATFLDVKEKGGPCEVALLLVPEEETGGKGTEVAWPALRDSGFVPDGVVVGEPTGLDIASSQKGLLVLELVAKGDACHSANAAAMGAKNAVRELARDLVALEGVDLGPEHPHLGRTTLEPTVTQGGKARNAVPEEATSVLDLRTVPLLTHAELVERVRATVKGEVRVRSERLKSVQCPEEAIVLAAARRARPEARVYGSRTMSDLVFFDGLPAIKCGPGQTERSHTPDEFVLASEVLEGVRFYGALVRALAALMHNQGGTSRGQAVVQG